MRTLEHARVVDLVAAFADRELTSGEEAIVREHLRRCARCRREIAVHEQLSAALALEPVPKASPGLRRRIERIGEPVPARAQRRWSWNRTWAASAAAAVVVVAVTGGTMLVRERAGISRRAADVPVLRDALADCRRAMSRNFPRKADLPAVTKGLPFAVRALDRPGAELFSTWKTTLAGSAAAGLAYRWRGLVVVQYVVAAELFHGERQVGEALPGVEIYGAVEDGQGIVAFLGGGTGTVLIGEVPPDELRRLIL